MLITRIEIKKFKELGAIVDDINKKTNELNKSLQKLQNYIREAEIRLVDDFPSDEVSEEN